VARALIVGCGCRGRELGAALAGEGWQVRGTSRSDAGLAAIESVGIEGAPADPDRVGTVLEHVGDVAVVVWALASAEGSPEEVEAINGPRLERLLERLVETPVRGFVYEAAGSAPEEVLAAGRALVNGAGERWQIPVAVVDASPGEHDAWTRAMGAAVRGLLA
jgi:nucleoside-diphosphate-sugar epimerase